MLHYVSEETSDKWPVLKRGEYSSWGTKDEFLGKDSDF